MIAQVSAYDWSYLSGYTWHASPSNRFKNKPHYPTLWYAYRQVELPRAKNGKRRRKKIYMHREIFDLRHIAIPEGWTIDHIDEDTLNNRWTNLQEVEHSKNCALKATRKMRKRKRVLALA